MELVTLVLTVKLVSLPGWTNERFAFRKNAVFKLTWGEVIFSGALLKHRPGKKQVYLAPC